MENISSDSLETSESEGLRHRVNNFSTANSSTDENTKEDECSKKLLSESPSRNGYIVHNSPKKLSEKENVSEEEDDDEDASIATTTGTNDTGKETLDSDDAVDDNSTAESSPSHNSYISDEKNNNYVHGGPYNEEENEGEDDYDYRNNYTFENGEWIPKIREPPSDEDSEDGLLIPSVERHEALAGIAFQLLESAKANQKAFDEDKEKRKSFTAVDEVLNWCGTSRELKVLSDMPGYLQFNKFVHSGYRQIEDFKGCFFSLFYLHNETVNIITHLAPIIYVLMFWRTMYPWEEIYLTQNRFLEILGWTHIFASISPWIGSVIYHTFMNHANGQEFYHFLLRMDMFGIWITECFGAMTNLTAATWCLPRDLQTWLMIAYGIATLWGLQLALTAKTPWNRRACFTSVVTARLLALFLRLSKYGGGNPVIILHVLLQDIISVIGGIIGVVRIPEKYFPGKLDLIFNSHCIMHVFVVWAVVHMHIAANGDIDWILSNYNQTFCHVEAVTLMTARNYTLV